MPRSYRFEHFRVPTTEAPKPGEPRSPPAHDVPPSAETLHYGRRFAQTEALFHRHAEERASQPPKRPAPGRPRREPIRAPPAEARPPVAPGDAAAFGLLSRLLRSAGLLAHAARDLTEASVTLLRLPIDAARLLVRRAPAR